MFHVKVEDNSIGKYGGEICKQTTETERERERGGGEEVVNCVKMVKVVKSGW